MTRTALLSNCLAAISVFSLVSFRSVAAKDAPPAAERTTQQSVASPDGSLEVEFALDDGVPSYSVTRFGRKLIDASRLGFLLKDAPGARRQLRPRFRTALFAHRKMGAAVGRKARHRQRLQRAAGHAAAAGRRWPANSSIVFRVYDDGVGFRYEWPEQPNLKELVIADELTEFNLAEDCNVWWIPAYEPEHYEYLYKKTKVSEVKKAHTPATFETADGVSLSIHEAALVDFASMVLVGDGSTKLKADLVPWSDGVKVRAAVPHRSPWRTIQIGDNPGELITSYLLLNLNEPCQAERHQLDQARQVRRHLVGDASRTNRPGAPARSTAPPPPTRSATSTSPPRTVSTACSSKVGTKAGTATGPSTATSSASPKPYPDFDLAELSRYAESKGVHLIGHHETGGAVPNYEQQLSDAFALYEKLGVPAVKTGYVNWSEGLQRVDDAGKPAGEWHYGQYMVRHHQHVIEEAAKHHIMVDVHEPVKPTGLRRTYPNLMTGEGARGQEYNAWSADGGNPPDHETDPAVHAAARRPDGFHARHLRRDLRRAADRTIA